MTKVQVVMPSINLWNRYTRPALDSVEVAMVRAKAHSIDCRVLLIDNASTDETLIEAGKRVGDHFSHKRNEERWSFAKSVNYGVNDAWERGYDYALVLNNDILLHPEAIWRLVGAFGKERDNPLGMATCLDLRGEIRPEELANYNPHEKDNVDEAPHPNFSAFMLNRDCWNEVGEMDEGFYPAYHEDNDYHYRMVVSGIEAIVLPTALFYHFGSRTQVEANGDGTPAVSHALFENNKSYMFRKWSSLKAEEIVYTHPFNDESRSIRSTAQNPSA